MYKLKLEKGKSAWIAIYPKFGEINVAIKCTDVTGKIRPYYFYMNSMFYKIACAPSEDSDKPLHTRSLTRIFTGHSVGSQVS